MTDDILEEKTAQPAQPEDEAAQPEQIPEETPEILPQESEVIEEQVTEPESEETPAEPENNAEDEEPEEEQPEEPEEEQPEEPEEPEEEQPEEPEEPEEEPLPPEYPKETEIADFDEQGNIVNLKLNWREFDISKAELKNGNEQLKASEWSKVYSKVAEQCNISGEYTIDYFQDRYTVRKLDEIEAIHYEAMTDEEKKAYDEQKYAEKVANKRAERDNLLVTVVDPIVTNPLRWAELSEAEQEKYKAYRLYLLDIPQQPEFPDIEIKSFKEFENE